MSNLDRKPLTDEQETQIIAAWLLSNRKGAEHEPTKPDWVPVIPELLSAMMYWRDTAHDLRRGFQHVLRSCDDLIGLVSDLVKATDMDEKDRKLILSLVKKASAITSSVVQLSNEAF